MNTVRSNPAWLLEYNKLEQQVKEYKRMYSNSNPNQRLADPNGQITVQVVVHIIHRTGEAIGVGANLSVAQVQSQIDVLNEDFSRTNPDANQTPSVFTGVAASPMLQFVLACRTPGGLYTNGITRTSSGTANSIIDPTAVKFTNQGGRDAWATDRYLNIWVTPNIGIGILGATQLALFFPLFPDTDGVVIRSDCFGRGISFNLDAQYNLGRTTTHEVGHWLNLIHVWGAGGGQLPNCNDSDECDDTPNQNIINLGVPSFPHISCSNGPNGDMFMNYMDYTDDVVMNLFSNDQRTRMRALFMPGGLRASFIDNYFKLQRNYPSCISASYAVNTPFCAADGNILWSVAGPATLTNPNSNAAFNYVSIQNGPTVNATVMVTASWNNFVSDVTFPIGYGLENSTYNPNYYNSSNRSMTVNSVNMTSYNNWTYGQVSFTGITAGMTAKNWRLVSCNSCNPQTQFLSNGNSFGVYLTQPYAFATLRAEIPTACGDRTVEYSFLGGYLNPGYTISPNPANNEITISASMPVDPNNRTSNSASTSAYEVQIFNSFNQLLKKTKVKKDDRDVTIDVSRFPSNQFYTIKLISDNDVQTKSFFKQ